MQLLSSEQWHSIKFHSLQEGLGLACGVVGAEVLVLLHLLLQGEELALQLIAQTRQGVPNVVGQLLERRLPQYYKGTNSKKNGTQRDATPARQHKSTCKPPSNRDYLGEYQVD